MDTTTLIVILSVILIAVVGITAAIFLKKRKTKELRTRFGPEYARAVQESGGRRQGEAGLQERSERNVSRVSQSGRSCQPTVTAMSRPGARFRHSLLTIPKVL
jgi:hypothetical protein